MPNYLVFLTEKTFILQSKRQQNSIAVYAEITKWKMIFLESMVQPYNNVVEI